MHLFKHEHFIVEFMRLFMCPLVRSGNHLRDLHGSLRQRLPVVPAGWDAAGEVQAKQRQQGTDKPEDWHGPLHAMLCWSRIIHILIYSISSNDTNSRESRICERRHSSRSRSQWVRLGDGLCGLQQHKNNNKPGEDTLSVGPRVPCEDSQTCVTCEAFMHLTSERYKMWHAEPKLPMLKRISFYQHARKPHKALESREPKNANLSMKIFYVTLVGSVNHVINDLVFISVMSNSEWANPKHPSRWCSLAAEMFSLASHTLQIK